MLKKKILFILEGGDAFVSGYVNGLIFREYFFKKNIKVKYVNRLNPKLLKLSNVPPTILLPFMNIGLRYLLRKIINILAFISEPRIVRLSKRYEIVCLVKVSSIHFLDRIRQNTKAKLVLYFGDAVWLWVKKFNELLGSVDVVITDNEYTASYIKKVNSKCEIVPDCSQIELFDAKRDLYKIPCKSKIIIGWIGSQRTSYDLYLIWEALEHLFEKYQNLHLRLLGIPNKLNCLPPFEKVNYSCMYRYSQDDMIREVLNMDIGLFPLFNIEASKVRGILKASIYMAGGVPIVCSPVGQCKDIIKNNINGFLASSTEEWIKKLEYLITQDALRDTIALEGLKTVRKHFTIEKSFHKLLEVLEV